MSGASISEMCLTAVVCVFLACSVADCNASKDARARVRAACVAHHSLAACKGFEP
jgi:predicted LPLAT superfamily acyltransferase